MAVALSPRTSVVGADLGFMVLASGRSACIGVDLDSGAFVIVRWPGGELAADAAARLRLFDVAAACLAPGAEAEDDPLERREAVCVVRPPRAVGQIRRRAAERYLRPLLLPAREHPLGFATASLPYWMVSNDGPSVCLVAPHGPVSVVRSGAGVSCRFEWRGVTSDLPLAEGAGTLAAAMDHSRRSVLTGAPLADLLGFAPRRVLVALSPPRDGTCHKVIPALLP